MENNAYSKEELFSLSIKEKLNFLKKYDRNYCIFGSGTHKYQLGEPLSEEKILSFEEKYGVKLPVEYRNFIQNIGDGGAGPGYGLFPLFENEKSSEHRFLNTPFLLKEDFNMDAYEEQVPCECLDCDICQYKDTCLNYEIGDYHFRYQSGTLAICFEGCTFYSRLILAGDMAGEIWAEGEGEGMKRINMGFMQWYDSWLNKSIEIILPFVNGVLERLSFEQILAIKGTHLLYFNFRKAIFVAGMMGLELDSPRNSKESQSKYINTVKKAYEQQLEELREIN